MAEKFGPTISGACCPQQNVYLWAAMYPNDLAHGVSGFAAGNTGKLDHLSCSEYAAVTAPAFPKSLHSPFFYAGQPTPTRGPRVSLSRGTSPGCVNLFAEWVPADLADVIADLPAEDKVVVFRIMPQTTGGGGVRIPGFRGTGRTDSQHGTASKPCTSSTRCRPMTAPPSSKNSQPEAVQRPRRARFRHRSAPSPRACSAIGRAASDG